ncbi:DUF6207 family protein [Streptomyces sp. NPDC059096]|uniref:DUF6207 family protein n=1 Tax=Streptomyces sp. NPDC059096 TaxID=3346727 RepID=UPI0036B698BD
MVGWRRRSAGTRPRACGHGVVREPGQRDACEPAWRARGGDAAVADEATALVLSRCSPGCGATANAQRIARDAGQLGVRLRCCRGPRPPAVAPAVPTRGGCGRGIP